MTLKSPKEEYERLVHRGENYVRYSTQRKGSGARTWHRLCARWLTDNLPDSGLLENVLLISAPKGSSWGSEGLSRDAVRAVQRVLKELYKARELLPFLQDEAPVTTPRSENIKKVFVVHGHDELLKVTIARFLAKLDLVPVILHEQPDLGRTVIEKFLAHSDVAFAVVLLTADDVGGQANQKPSTFQYRARQNVILELGYFIARLGRSRVAAIYQEGVEIPSDYSGVLYIPHDSTGDWQLRLARELKASGLKIDANKIL